MENCSQMEQFCYNLSKRLTTWDDVSRAGLAVLASGRSKPLSSGTDNKAQNRQGQGYNSTTSTSA
jgi:hypothetical protein